MRYLPYIEYLPYIDSDLSTDKGGPDALGIAVYDIPLCCGSWVGFRVISEMGELWQDAGSESGGEDAEHDYLPRA